MRKAVEMLMAIGFAFDASARDAWYQDLGTDSPLLLALLHSESDLDLARMYLTRSIETDVRGVTELTRSFLHGLVASRTGDPELAVAQFARLDSVPARLNTFDLGWGLRNHSILLRAEAYEEIADTARALAHYERFVGLWPDADTLAMTLVLRARRGIERMGGQP